MESNTCKDHTNTPSTQKNTHHCKTNIFFASFKTPKTRVIYTLRIHIKIPMK